MFNKVVAKFIIFIFLLALFVVACLPQSRANQEIQPSPSTPVLTSINEPTLIQIPTATPVPSSTPIPPTVTPTAVPAQPLLGYLRDGNVWLFDLDSGLERAITNSGNIKAFAWSPDGTQIAVYDNQWQLCFHAINFNDLTLPCLTVEKAQNLFAADHAPTKLLWSPSGQKLLIQQAEWWLVNLGNLQISHIADPRDWGATWTADTEGGTALGQVVFLPNDSFLGTAAHLYDCGSGGCLYRLFVFDETSQRLMPYAFADGGTSLTLTTNGRYLMTQETPHVGCANYNTYTNIVDLTSGQLWSSTFPQEAFWGHTLAPNEQKAILSPGEGCSGDESQPWSFSCGLMFDPFEIYPMQLWDWQTNTRQDLVPGLQPTWSPDGQYIAFRSCLAQALTSEWVSVSAGPPWLYLMNLGDDSHAISPIAIGEAPAWQPR